MEVALQTACADEATQFADDDRVLREFESGAEFEAFKASRQASLKTVDRFERPSLKPEFRDLLPGRPSVRSSGTTRIPIALNRLRLGGRRCAAYRNRVEWVAKQSLGSLEAAADGR